jgi:phosphoglycolate phosphatase
MYKYIIFDFDGTIADSDKTVNDILSDLAVKYHFDRVSPKVFKHKSELSFPKKIKMLLFIHRVESEFKNRYGEAIASIKAFDHMLAVISQIHDAGYTIAILSSNTKSNIEKFFQINQVPFGMKVLPSKGLFGKHKAITGFMKESLCGPKDVLYVGDEIRDIKACKKSGVDIAFVRWGLDGDEDISILKPNYVISSPQELDATLEKQMEEYKASKSL